MKPKIKEQIVKTKAEILAQIAANPEQALRDIETLRSQIAADRLILKGKESLIRYFAAVAEDYWRQYHLSRKALIRARILVSKLKNACQDAQETRDSHFSAD